jgi:hypothetical protein
LQSLRNFSKIEVNETIADVLRNGILQGMPASIKLKAKNAPDGVSGVSIQVKEYLDVVKQALAAAK